MTTPDNSATDKPTVAQRLNLRAFDAARTNYVYDAYNSDGMTGYDAELDLRAADTITALQAERDKLRSIVAGVDAARRRRYVGPTGGGNPAVWYDTDAVEAALCGYDESAARAAEGDSEE